MFQTKHEGKDCYDKAMSPESPKLRLEALDLISILLVIARTLYFQLNLI